MTDAGTPGSSLGMMVVRGAGGRTIRLSGELDGAAALGLQTLLDDVEANERIELDGSDLTFVDSMGLRLMVEWHRRLQDVGGQFFVSAPSDALQRVLEVTQLDRVLLVDGQLNGSDDSQGDVDPGPRDRGPGDPH